MPKKSKDKGKQSKKKEQVEPGPESDPVILFRNYTKQCQSVGVAVNEILKRALCSNENENCASQLLIGTNEESRSSKPLGSCGIRALVAAILGKCNHGETQKYTALKEIRIWRSNLGDHGAMAIAKLMREGGREHRLAYIELIDNNIGLEGSVALGRSLCAGSLVSLNLDYNPLGTSGVAALAKGLCLNNTLKKLSLRYCRVDENGGESLSQILSSPTIILNNIDLAGNMFTGKGLKDLCKGLNLNSTLQALNLADNYINKDVDAMKLLSDVLKDHKSLNSMNLLNNEIGVEGALVLLEGIEENRMITSFQVDPKLPSNIYLALNRVPSKSKGKKKKAKKKKKKKK